MPDNRFSLSALRWEDIEDGCIHVHATEEKVERDGKNTSIISDTPKTDAGNRYIPIPEVALEIFSLAKKYNPDSEYIFSYQHERIRGDKFRSRLKRVCEKAGVPYKHPHIIRKTFATHCIESGMTYHNLIGIMGHVSEDITKRFYERQRTSREEKQLIVNDIFKE